MRIVSLSPWITDALASLGLATSVAAVPESRVRPAAPGLPTTGPDLLSRALSRGGADVDAIAALEPTLLLVESTHKEFGITIEDLHALATARLGPGCTLVSFRPMRLSDAFRDLETLGRLTGTTDRALRLVATLRRELDVVARDARARLRALRLSVAVVSAAVPARGVGRFVPSLVELAGGRPVLLRAGDADREVSPAELAQSDPDVLLFAAPESPVPVADEIAARFAAQPGNVDLIAVREKRLFPLDGRRLLRGGLSLGAGLEDVVRTLSTLVEEESKSG